MTLHLDCAISITNLKQSAGQELYDWTSLSWTLCDPRFYHMLVSKYHHFKDRHVLYFCYQNEKKNVYWHTEKLAHKYNCAKIILSLGYPILAANVQFYLHCKCKTTSITESSKYILIYRNIGLVLQNKFIVRESTISAFPVIFKILFTNMLHCSPWYTFFRRANLDIALEVISFYTKKYFFIPTDLWLSAAACCYICSQVTAEVSLVN